MVAKPGHLHWSSMTTTTASQGLCLVCGQQIGEDAAAHFAQQHRGMSRRPYAPPLTWMERLDNVITALTSIREETDIDAQIRQMDDDVIQELYLVRARLALLKNAVKKGSGNGSS